MTQQLDFEKQQSQNQSHTAVLWPEETRIGADEAKREQVDFWKMAYFWKTMPDPTINRYPISLLSALVWLGYTDLEAAKADFRNQFKESRIVFWTWIPHTQCESDIYVDDIYMTVNCFKRFIMTANTSRAVDLRTYFIMAEETLTAKTGTGGVSWVALKNFMYAPNLDIPYDLNVVLGHSDLWVSKETTVPAWMRTFVNTEFTHSNWLTSIAPVPAAATTTTTTTTLQPPHFFPKFTSSFPVPSPLIDEESDETMHSVNTTTDAVLKERVNE